MPFSLVLQKLSSFYASSEIFNMLLVNLLAAMNFANVFLNKKTLKRKKCDQNKKTLKTFLHLCLCVM